jgi:hypothetical protein
LRLTATIRYTGHLRALSAMSAVVGAAGLRLAPPRGAVAHRGRAAARQTPHAPNAPRAARPAPRLRATAAAMRASAGAASAPLAAGAPEPAVAAQSVPRRKVAVFVEPSPFSHTSGMKNRFLNLISNLTDQGDEVRDRRGPARRKRPKAALRRVPAATRPHRPLALRCGAHAPRRGCEGGVAVRRALAASRCALLWRGRAGCYVHWPARLAPPLRFTQRAPAHARRRAARRLWCSRRTRPLPPSIAAQRRAKPLCSFPLLPANPPRAPHRLRPPLRCSLTRPSRHVTQVYGLAGVPLPFYNSNTLRLSPGISPRVWATVRALEGAFNPIICEPDRHPCS